MQADSEGRIFEFFSGMNFVASGLSMFCDEFRMSGEIVVVSSRDVECYRAQKHESVHHYSFDLIRQAHTDSRRRRREGQHISQTQLWETNLPASGGVPWFAWLLCFTLCDSIHFRAAAAAVQAFSKRTVGPHQRRHANNGRDRKSTDSVLTENGTPPKQPARDAQEPRPMYSLREVKA